MFREMRRNAQQISTEECVELLKHASSGVLGLYGDNGYPYTVPVSFLYIDGENGTAGKIIFHCAITGHLVDSLRRNEKVSFCVVVRDDICPEFRTTKYCSVIAFGKARFLETDDELRAAVNAIGAKYAIGYEHLCREKTEKTIRTKELCCVEIRIEHLTGKISRFILAERQAQ